MLNIKDLIHKGTGLFICLLFFPVLIFAEKTAGNCAIFSEPTGEQVAELYPYTFFISHPFSENRCQILLDCWVKKNQQYDGIRLEKGAILLNSKFKKIGKVIRPFNPMREIESNDSLAHIQISAYMDKFSIDPATVPELSLEKLLSSAAQNEKFSYFENYLKEFGFSQQEKHENYESWLIPEFDFVTQTYSTRLLIIFYKGELISIFHNRPVKVKIYDSIETGGKFGMIYNSKFTENSKTVLMEIYKKQILLKH
ncbi:MAG: hypothetical protein ACOVP1_02340 [Bacteroidia bacterium]